MAQEVGLTDAEWDALLPWDQDELIQDLAMAVEIGNDFELNSVYADVAKLRDELGWPRGSYRFVDVPGTERAASGRRLEDLPPRGAEYVIESDGVSIVTLTVWLPKFPAPGFIGLDIAEKFAHFVDRDKVC